MAMVPTYNEAGNIKNLINQILSLGTDYEVLVVDDNSPDKTAEIVQDLAASDPRVHLLLRKERKGRGWAGIDGFKEALNLGADMVVEMDGDGSHEPSYIPKFVQEAGDCDVVVGSRFVEGGKDEHRTFLRRAISNFARLYLKFMIGASVNDPTSGFRLFKAEALKQVLPRLKARDPFIVTEVLFFLHKAGLKIKEYPICFMPRNAGESKLRPHTLIKYLFKVLYLRLRFSSNLRILLSAVVFIAVLFYASHILFYENTWLSNLLYYDIIVFHFVNLNLNNAILNWPMSIISYLDSVGINLSLVILFIICALFIKRHYSGNFYMVMLFFVLALLASSILVHILKEYIHRPRPMAVFGLDDVSHFYEFAVTNSFPSGHTQSAFVMCFFVFRLIKKYRLVFFILPFFVAFERMYVGMHFPLDTFVGAIIGIVSAEIFFRFYENHLKARGLNFD